MNKELDLMADYVFLSMYSQKKRNGELENWNETINRIYSMHLLKLNDLHLMNSTVLDYLHKAKELEYQKKILSSQRCRQFAQDTFNDGILKHETKMYNCTSTYVDRVGVFGEIMYLLLCGCGVGFSLHKDYVSKLPVVNKKENPKMVIFVIPDSIEGWGDSIHFLMKTLYEGDIPSFDYSLIREKNSIIAGKFKAPGHEPLQRAHEKIIHLFQNIGERKLKTVEVYDVLCYIAESVIAGGVRRSAMIALFDKDDNDMLKSKTGNWWVDNPQRAMTNNSILTSYNDCLSYKEIKEATKIIRQFGEPGNVNVPNYDWVCNPCGEIIMKPSIDGKTGFSFCNLVEINAEKITNEEDFYEACEVAAFLSTVQALYVNFKFINSVSIDIAKRDRNIGVSITGLFANSFLKKDVLKQGAKTVVEANIKFAKIFGINNSRSCTTIKPSGNASTILGLSCSGIHPAHAKKYLRRIRIRTNSEEYKALKDTPLVKLLRGEEAVISFPIEVNDGVKLKDDLTAVEHLNYISMVKHYWINKGSAESKINNNISATVEVMTEEWEEVAAVIYTHSYLFTGISLLPKLGDQIYDNAPFQRLSTPELEEEYNAAKEYINTHYIDFNLIMSKKEGIAAGTLVASGCSNGSCTLI